ncbi:MAG: GYD domain-containing protein [Candidatus Bathyarchaeota archaeon]|nr:GYD domain-containing protein [Candidatus Bathyarchaeota archaeon]
MQRYIVLINFTEQGLEKIKDLPKRVQAARRAIEKACGNFVEWNLTMGIYDAVAIVEIPNDASAAAILLGAGKEGNIHTITLKAFSEAKAAKIIAKLS